LARLLHLGGKTSEAVVRAEGLADAHPKWAPARVFLARILLAEGQVEEARRHYEAARGLESFGPDQGLEKDLGRPPVPEKPPRLGATPDGWQESEGAPARDGDEVGGPVARVEIGGGRFERPTIKFEHVGGCAEVKEEIRMKILYPLRNPDLFRAYGKAIGGGVLLYGPPGCGKTLMARATAGEIDANFLAIGLHEVLDMWMGQSEKNLHEIFELAREQSPTILFFDEVDALAADRVDLRRSAGRTLINQFLAEMDGSGANNDGLLILGATNAPWHIDPAFRRPGRFDRVLFVPPPDEAARVEIIQVLAQGKPVADLDAAALAKKTKDFSGADLKSVFDITIERCLAQAMRKGEVVPITTRELLATAKEARPSTRAWFESAKNYALFSNQSGFYNDVLKFLGMAK
jgi:transitional endoplasmic reticulum ATPase